MLGCYKRVGPKQECGPQGRGPDLQTRRGSRGAGPPLPGPSDTRSVS